MYLHIHTYIGAPFNQLAALSGNKHEGLDAVYYYMRRLGVKSSIIVLIVEGLSHQ